MQGQCLTKRKQSASLEAGQTFRWLWLWLPAAVLIRPSLAGALSERFLPGQADVTVQKSVFPRAQPAFPPARSLSPGPRPGLGAPSCFLSRWLPHLSSSWPCSQCPGGTGPARGCWEPGAASGATEGWGPGAGLGPGSGEGLPAEAGGLQTPQAADSPGPSAWPLTESG